MLDEIFMGKFSVWEGAYFIEGEPDLPFLVITHQTT